MDEQMQTKKGMSGVTVTLLILLTAVVFGGGAYAYMNNKAVKEKNDLNAQITELQNKAATSGITATTTPSSLASATKTSTSAATDWKTYTNNKYGFTLTFNDLWKNYQVIEKKPDDKTASAFLYVCVPTASSKWNDIQDGVFCPFSITVVNVSNYEEFKQATDPMTPTYIDKNSSYVFFYSTCQDRPEDGVSTVNDLKNIIATFKLL